MSADPRPRQDPCCQPNQIAVNAQTTGHEDPETLPQLFREAYLGRFDNRFAYTRHRMREQGWEDVLEENGMAGFFNDRDYTHHLFTREVLDIHRPDHLPCEPGDDVFRRRPTPPTVSN